MLDGQVAVIVGAAGGIGRAVVARYLAEGASVLAVDRCAERLEKLAADLDGPRLATRPADACTWEASVAMVDDAVARFGGVDVLVCTTGVFDQAVPLADIPGERLAAALEESFRVNVTSMALNVRAALPQLAARRGRVVLTASYASFLPAGGGVPYTAAKHAVAGLVRQLAYELAPGVRVNGVAPGVAATTMRGLDSLGQAPRDCVLPGTESVLPLGRIPDAGDYGGIYALLGSAGDSAAMTGEIVRVDSGLSVRGLGRTAGGGAQ